MSEPFYYGMDGQPITREEAYKLWEGDIENTRQVASTKIGEARISTVLLVHDHNLGFEGPPILFETMVFGGPEKWDNFQIRYATREEAEIGHAGIVAALEADEFFEQEGEVP